MLYEGLLNIHNARVLAADWSLADVRLDFGPLSANAVSNELDTL